MLQVHRGAWVLPISRPPIRDGWVAVDAGRIVGVGGPHDPPPVPGFYQPSLDEDPTGPRTAILPGLVNAHTHLELSWMHGRVEPAPTMPAWVERLLALRRTVGGDPAEPIIAAIAEAHATGTALVGDITNTCAAYEPLADSDLSAAIFRELVGFNVPDAAALVADAAKQIEELMPLAWLRPSIVPHAPYSVSPSLLRAIAAAAGDRPISIHLGESAEEMQFLREGTGAWRQMLAALRVWTDEWSAPACGPVAYLDSFGLVNERLVAVHCVQLTDEELARLAAARATVVACPRSNAWTGAGTPPIERFYASGVRVAIGTDSLASVEDLNMFSELAAMRRLAPGVPVARLLESATRAGADALGFGDELGAIEVGKQAALLGVTIPPGVDEVEAFLVSGVSEAAVRWLDC
jgi:aminodeoxyfutalosine deaminase